MSKIGLKALCIADTHSHINREDVKQIGDLARVADICFCLGDINYRDMEAISMVIPNDKILGILGNHDTPDILDDFGIKHIHGEEIIINGIIVTGWSGTYAYKENIPISFSQDESVSFASLLPKADILISHDAPYNLKEDDMCHKGLKGISKYVKEKCPMYHIHGHLHEEYTRVHGVFRKTKEVCIYKYRLLSL